MLKRIGDRQPFKYPYGVIIDGHRYDGISDNNITVADFFAHSLLVFESALCIGIPVLHIQILCLRPSNFCRPSFFTSETPSVACCISMHINYESVSG